MAKLKVALLFLTLAATAQGEWTIVSSRSEPARDGVIHRHVAMENAGTSANVDLDFALFSAKTCTLQLIDNESGATDLAETMKRAECFAGINGGYFDPNFAPIGLRIIHGKTTARLVRARLITGVLLSSTHRVQIVRTGEFSTKQQVATAIQCGPFLVDRGQPVRGLDDSRSARRTFAVTGASDRAALGVCSEVSLAQLSEILATPRLSDDLKVQRALNLDGGSSSAFWCARENGAAFSIPEQKRVRDFVGIVPSR